MEGSSLAQLFRNESPFTSNISRNRADMTLQQEFHFNLLPVVLVSNSPTCPLDPSLYSTRMDLRIAEPPICVTTYAM